MSSHDESIGSATGQIRLSSQRADGVKTTVSMPASEYARYVALCGSRKELRKHLNWAVKHAEVRPGYSRSMLVRLHLDECIKSVQS
jgi:hypothetical protein